LRLLPRNHYERANLWLLPRMAVSREIAGGPLGGARFGMSGPRDRINGPKATKPARICVFLGRHCAGRSRGPLSGGSVSFFPPSQGKRNSRSSQGGPEERPLPHSPQRDRVQFRSESELIPLSSIVFSVSRGIVKALFRKSDSMTAMPRASDPPAPPRVPRQGSRLSYGAVPARPPSVPCLDPAASPLSTLSIGRDHFR